jgi:hypothetical protein
MISRSRFANQAAAQRRDDARCLYFGLNETGYFALNGGSTMSAPTSARGGKAEMLRTTPIRRSKKRHPISGSGQRH